MKFGRTIFFAMLALAGTATPAQAGVFSDDLARCLVTKSTEADNAAFMAWMFSVVSADPRLAKLTTLDRAKRDKMGAEASATMQRLLLVDCRKEAVAAMKTEGVAAVTQSFNLLGQSATQQLFRSPEAQAELEALGKTFDETKLEALMDEAGVARPSAGDKK